ncbi:hypothetical protein AAKU67_004416 [Oxalobacteraceae bacterium GrIS 2.11]
MENLLSRAMYGANLSQAIETLGSISLESWAFRLKRNWFQIGPKRCLLQTLISQ